MPKVAVSGLPDVAGLEGLVEQDNLVADSDKGTPAPAAEPQTTQQPAVPKPDTTPKPVPPRNEFGQFKTPDDLLKAYKEVQGFSTRMAQENKATEEKLAQLQERLELMQYQRPVPQVQQSSPERDFDSLFIENPQKAVSEVASQAVRQQIQTTRLAEVLDEENAKNPQDYQERLAYANQLSQQFPQLAASPTGVRKLFQMADQYRKADYQRKGMAFVKAVIGEDVDFEKFKAAIKKDQSPQTQIANNAYMPDTTSSTRTGPQPEKIPSNETEIQDAVKKGDIDAVLNAQFRALGLRT